jgi:tRNA U34 2-thiouridine synthase MnmA/TrmU
MLRWREEKVQRFLECVPVPSCTMVIFSCFTQAEYIPPNPGPIIDLSTGKQIAEHRGLWTFTIGQNARISGLKTKTFVARKSRKDNAVYVVSGP